MRICDRCRSEEAVRVACDVALCPQCAMDVNVGQGFVGQEGTIEGAGEGIGGHGNARGPAAPDAGKAIEKTATAAGEIARTVKVVAIVGAVGAAAWIGYALWRARQQAVGLQAGAQHAILAHPELLRL